ncbi:MAG: hypothetical protein KME40_08010 [Komarekiella atlantica HA4396-MV6]|nr:hypothetical protein [Komarekiella atlantica HA4396-MV6]
MQKCELVKNEPQINNGHLLQRGELPEVLIAGRRRSDFSPQRSVLPMKTDNSSVFISVPCGKPLRVYICGLISKTLTFARDAMSCTHNKR